MLACLKRKSASQATRPDIAGLILSSSVWIVPSLVPVASWSSGDSTSVFVSAKFRKTSRQNSGIQRGETRLRINDKRMNAHQDNTYTRRDD